MIFLGMYYYFKINLYIVGAGVEVISSCILYAKLACLLTYYVANRSDVVLTVFCIWLLCWL